MFEPDVLDVSAFAMFELERLISQGKYKLPALQTGVDLSELLVVPQITTSSILNGLPGRDYRCGVSVRELLQEGPAKVFFALANHSTPLNDLLEAQGISEHTNVLFVLRGSLAYAIKIPYKGHQFQRLKYGQEMHLDVVSDSNARDITIDSGSILLIGTPSHGEQVLDLELDEYVEPMRLRSMTPQLRGLLRGQSIGSNTVALRTHRGDELLDAHSGMFSFAIHTPSEQLLPCRDLFVLGACHQVQARLPRHSLDVVLS